MAQGEQFWNQKTLRKELQLLIRFSKLDKNPRWNDFFIQVHQKAREYGDKGTIDLLKSSSSNIQ